MNTRKVDAPAAGWLAAGVVFFLAVVAVVLVGAPVQADTGILDPPIFATTDGQQIFARICQGCHMQNAQGAVGAGRYPALANNPALASKQYMALTILMGRRNMPAFGAKHAIGFGGPPATLSEEQIAAVINYVRTHFGNQYTDSISSAEVTALDQSLH
jgi:mono/diheme cytochrome c family protein